MSRQTSSISVVEAISKLNNKNALSSGTNLTQIVIEGFDVDKTLTLAQLANIRSEKIYQFKNVAFQVTDEAVINNSKSKSTKVKEPNPTIAGVCEFLNLSDDDKNKIEAQKKYIQALIDFDFSSYQFKNGIQLPEFILNQCTNKKALQNTLSKAADGKILQQILQEAKANLDSITSPKSIKKIKKGHRNKFLAPVLDTMVLSGSGFQNNLDNQNYLIRNFRGFTITDNAKITLAGDAATKVGGKSSEKRITALDIQNTTFEVPVDFSNVVFKKAKKISNEFRGANFKKGIIFNRQTDYRGCNTDVYWPNDMSVTFLKPDGTPIEKTVAEWLDAIETAYYRKRKGGKSKSTVRSDYFAKLQEKYHDDKGAKLFALLRHMQNQQHRFLLDPRNRGTYDAFQAVIKEPVQTSATNTPRSSIELNDVHADKNTVVDDLREKVVTPTEQPKEEEQNPIVASTAEEIEARATLLAQKQAELHEKLISGALPFMLAAHEATATVLANVMLREAQVEKDDVKLTLFLSLLKQGKLKSARGLLPKNCDEWPVGTNEKINAAAQFLRDAAETELINTGKPGTACAKLLIFCRSPFSNTPFSEVLKAKETAKNLFVSCRLTNVIGRIANQLKNFGSDQYLENINGSFFITNADITNLTAVVKNGGYIKPYIPQSLLNEWSGCLEERLKKMPDGIAKEMTQAVLEIIARFKDGKRIEASMVVPIIYAAYQLDEAKRIASQLMNIFVVNDDEKGLADAEAFYISAFVKKVVALQTYLENKENVHEIETIKKHFDGLIEMLHATPEDAQIIKLRASNIAERVQEAKDAWLKDVDRIVKSLDHPEETLPDLDLQVACVDEDFEENSNSVLNYLAWFGSVTGVVGAAKTVVSYVSWVAGFFHNAAPVNTAPAIHAPQLKT